MRKKTIFFVVVLILVLLIAGSFWYLQSQKHNEQLIEVFEGGQEKNETGKIDISNWRVYQNKKFGFEIKYPENWQMAESYSGDSIVIAFAPEEYKKNKREYTNRWRGFYHEQFENYSNRASVFVHKPTDFFGRGTNCEDEPPLSILDTFQRISKCRNYTTESTADDYYFADEKFYYTVSMNYNNNEKSYKEIGEIILQSFRLIKKKE